jgi:hypothetical protein
MSESNNEPNYILALLNIIVWFRLVSFLRLFRATRALIRLVIEIVKDMSGFIIVLLMAIMAFSITFNIFSEE